jgi:6-phosphofructokinase
MGARERRAAKHGYRYKRTESHAQFDLNNIVNYATPGYATAVFVSAQGVERIRTTAESHRRIAIIEVMGRHSGYIALGTAYGQPDIVLVPEIAPDLELLVERVKHFTTCKKTSSSSAAKASWTNRAANSARKPNPPTRRATWF